MKIIMVKQTSSLQKRLKACWHILTKDNYAVFCINDNHIVWNEDYHKDNDYQYCIPCWSLSALLNLMICPNIEEYIKGKWDLTAFTDGSLKTPIEVQDCWSAVGTCYEMILKLHELKLL